MDPTLKPSDQCVSAGTKYTCTATSGHPLPLTYAFYYWHHGDSNSLTVTDSSNSPPSYTVQRTGNFSVSCAVTYAHRLYKECYAMCYANTSATVFGDYFADI